jgi:hypothetical protein
VAKLLLSHYSPIFANKTWADNDGYISYFSCQYSKTVKKSPKGRKQWGRKRGLYTWDVERALDKELENDAAPVYEKLLHFNEIDLGERKVWAQFLLSQLVRTPSYMKYESFIRSELNLTDTPKHDRVGCKECGDINFVANRDWCLLLAHEDDYFVRSDNPILQTGFIERPETCLFYPLSPRLCFVSCSMKTEWDAFSHIPNETCGYEMEKGGAHFINFHLAKAAGESLIISPQHDGLIAEKMYFDVLGMYPQPPFSLHNISLEDTENAYKSIQTIMSKTDGTDYPSWLPFELEPYYQLKSREGVA